MCKVYRCAYYIIKKKKKKKKPVSTSYGLDLNARKHNLVSSAVTRRLSHLCKLLSSYGETTNVYISLTIYDLLSNPVIVFIGQFY